MKQLLKLPERLAAIAGFIENGASVADIGTDHGFVPVYLAQNGLARRIIASDMSAASLETARGTAKKHGVADNIEFITAQGLAGIGEHDADTVVISGLGGETIAGIIRDAPWTRRSDMRLILQPQSKINELCRYLHLCGYALIGAKLARDSGRLYIAMLVCGGNSDSGLEPELELLTRLMQSGDPLLADYFDELIAKTRLALEGMKSSGSPEILEMALRLSVYISMKEVHDNANRK